MPASLSRQRYVNHVTQSTNLRLSMAVALAELSVFINGSESAAVIACAALSLFLCAL